MSLHWPWALAALLVVPLLLGIWWWLRRKRRQMAVRVSSVALIQAALPGRSHWRRRIPVILFVTGLLFLGTAAARPQASVLVPSDSSTILLAMDVSRSMCSTDVEPNRLTAASEAARGFVLAQSKGTKIGLVSFAGVAGLLVEPTSDRAKVLEAIDGLKTARATAIGMAILTSIDAIAEINPDVAPTGIELEVDLEKAVEEYQPDAIVVLTDGANTQGVDPVTAAEQAAARRIRIYTIGFGTTMPSRMACSLDQIGDNGVGPGEGRFAGGGGGRYQRINEVALTEVAKMTGGEYFRAQDSEELVAVLSDLPRKISLQRQDVEITSWFVLFGSLFAMAAVGLSLWWNRALSLPTLPASSATPTT